MKFNLDEILLCDIDDSSKDCIDYFINSDTSEQFIIESIKWNVTSFFDQYKEKFKKEWLPVLFSRVEFIPTDEKELLKLIFSQPDYKSRKQKDIEHAMSQNANFEVS